MTKKKKSINKKPNIVSESNPKRIPGPTCKKKGYDLTEELMRYVMSITRSNREAAEWLQIAVTTWNRWAKKFIDQETGKTLYQLQTDKYNSSWRDRHADHIISMTNKRRATIDRLSGDNIIPLRGGSPKVPLDDILAGKHYGYNEWKLKERMIKECVILEACEICGYQERRVYDLTVPLRMHFNDGDHKNVSRENIQLLCHNCYYVLTPRSLRATSKSTEFELDDETGELVRVGYDYRGKKKLVPSNKSRLERIRKIKEELGIPLSPDDY